MSPRRRTVTGAALVVAGAVFLDVGLIRLLEAATCSSNGLGENIIDTCERDVGLKVALLVAGFIVGFAGLWMLSPRDSGGQRIGGPASLIAAGVPLLNGILLLVGWSGSDALNGSAQQAVIAFAVGSLLSGAVAVPHALATIRGT